MHLASVRPVVVKVAVASVPHVVVKVAVASVPHVVAKVAKVAKVAAVSVRDGPHLVNNFLLTSFDKSRWPWPAGFFYHTSTGPLGTGMAFRFASEGSSSFFIKDGIIGF